MCGICGVVALDGALNLPAGAPERMIGVQRHRGPDEFGAWRDDRVFFGHARLSIIDLVSGQQPLCNEDGSVWITFNGEVFNYIELAAELEALGHVLRTRSDTEVIVHAYEQWGDACVERFVGQFAFAIRDRRRDRVLLARDRFGIRPLYLAEHDGALLFGSEIKALRAFPGFRPGLDPAGLAEVCTFWSALAPRTAFAGVAQLPPGHVAVLERSPSGPAPTAPLPRALRLKRYWHPTFLPEAEDRRRVEPAERDRIAARLRELLVDAALIRLRADVPVGAYLSGGLDSSATAALVRGRTGQHLKTFSVGFADPAYDETAWQHAMARHIGTDHCTVGVDAEDIAGRFADVVWGAETPILRTAPAPLHALSGLVRAEGYKVVLTGEGADEVFAGYNIFREAKVRRFWSRRPGDRARARLLSRLYPYLEKSPPEFLRQFYGQGLDDPDDPFFSHRPRWNNTRPIAALLADLPADAAAAAEDRLRADLPEAFAGWGVVARAQYLEMTTFLAGYLLSSQGDRMLMGHSVEGRFPFLDHRLAEFAGTIPASLKLESLAEKAILKRAVADLLPAGILSRPKQPYRAPDAVSFNGPAGREIVAAFLDDDPASAWHDGRVAALRRKWEAGRLTSVRDNMAFLAVLSGRMLERAFGRDFEDRLAGALPAPDLIAWRTGPAD